MPKLPLRAFFAPGLLLALAVPALTVACGDDDTTTTPVDAGALGDGTVNRPDSGGFDAGPDSAPVDSGWADTGPADSGPADSGPACAVPYGCTAYLCSATPATAYATTAVSAPGPIVAANGAYTFTNGQTVLGQTSANVPQGASARTLSLWVKTTAAPTSQSLFTYGSFAAGKEFGLLTSTNNAYFVGFNADLSSAKNITDNAWHHVAATYDGAQLSLYVDGVQVATKSIVLNTTGTDFAIGQSISQPGREPFAGSLSDIRIYNRVLTAAELTAAASLAANGNPETLRNSATGLVYWLPLIGGTASENDRCAAAP
jgi:hypothetical protein